MINPHHLDEVQIRSFKDERDFKILRDIIRRCQDYDKIDETSNEEKAIRGRYQHLTNCDLSQDFFIVEMSGDVLGFARLWWRQELKFGRSFEHIFFVRPEARKYSVYEILLDNIWKRAAEITANWPYIERQTPRPIFTRLDDRDITSDQLLRVSGYQPVAFARRLVRPTLIEIKRIPVPEGFELRSVNPGHFRLIWDAWQEADREYWRFSPATEEDYKAWIQDTMLTQCELWRVAWTGDEVAGQVRSYIDIEENRRFNRKRGYTEWIMVGPTFRRKGLARALLLESMVMLREHGMKEVALGVELNNPPGAALLYRKLGYQVTGGWTTFQKDLALG